MKRGDRLPRLNHRHAWKPFKLDVASGDKQISGDRWRKDWSGRHASGLPVRVVSAVPKVTRVDAQIDTRMPRHKFLSSALVKRQHTQEVLPWNALNREHLCL